jgi:hypothetical protein
MSFQAGKIHLITPLLLLFILVVRAFVKTSTGSIQKLSVFWIGIFSISVFLMLPQSEFVYEQLQLGKLVNFPWRWLEIVTFASACLAAFVVTIWGKGRVIVALVLCLVVICLSWPFARIISYQLDGSDDEYKQMVRTNTGFLPDTEFAPLGSSTSNVIETRGEKRHRQKQDHSQ